MPHREAVDVTDTTYADVSEWQTPVDDSYPYRVLSIRSNDGTYRDRKWAQNYRWCVNACDSGRLVFFIVYFVWRQNWQAAVDTLKSQVGTPHPRMVVMMDIESWQGQITGDQSDGINSAYWAVADWLGDPGRVIAYANTGDLRSLWPRRPQYVRLVGAGYPVNPNLPGQVAHQYTNGEIQAGGKPLGAPPFGPCDMNIAYGLDPWQFAAACGVNDRALLIPGIEGLFV